MSADTDDHFKPPGYVLQTQEAAFEGNACWWCDNYNEKFSTWPHPELGAGKCQVPGKKTFYVDGSGICPLFSKTAELVEYRNEILADINAC